ncbi:MAG: AAA family ATPase [Aureispira sp.]
MIKEIRIKNFKSVQKLKLDLGRVNVFIGANGCGKSNILEAVTFGAAAAADKLDNEFLASRGVRVTNHSMMRSSFGTIKNDNDVNISFESPLKEMKLSLFLKSSDGDFPKWYPFIEEVEGLTGSTIEKMKEKLKVYSPLEYIKNFLIYAPENLALRNFKSEAQIEPLGIHGEGLFYLLTILSKDRNKHKLKEIKQYLKLFDWFEDFQLTAQTFGQQSLAIQDRFIHADLFEIDQRSANEGFLYLLFYLTLFISDYTPPFFAIDNIDNALNPKLCAELTKILTELAKKHEKQVLLTTHNPAILDGLDLSDEENRLFVVYRNLDGHTKVRQVEKKEIQQSGDTVKLSEAFMRGYLGGLNKF